MTRFDFYLLKPFTEFSVFKDFGDKLMMNEWGGGDVFFTLPWYFMNYFKRIYVERVYIYRLIRKGGMTRGWV